MVQDDTNRHASSRGKLLGACHHLSTQTGIPATLLRIGAVALLCVWFKLTIIAYCAAAVVFHFRQR